MLSIESRLKLGAPEFRRERRRRRGAVSEGRLNSDCVAGDRVIYHDPTPLHGLFHAVVARRVELPSGTVRYELDLEDPRPGDPPFRFATGREIHRDAEICLRCTTDVSVPAQRFTR